MGIIHQLPEVVASRIAAGEVVQRPASVIKEVIENSLDAGATRIWVTIEQGGHRLMRVVDDGCGMSAEDLPLCVARHATSKIQSEVDLLSIQTHGFRGEALAAIASVSQTEIISRQPHENRAWRLFCEGGTLRPLTPVGAPPGTSVSVSELFYNTPARRKFLKTPSTEFERIGQVVQHAALCNPDVHFELGHNQRRPKQYLAVPGCADRLVQIYGQETFDQLLPVEHQTDQMQITGFTCRPTLHRQNASDMVFFVNRRFVRDRLLVRLATEAYRASLPQRRYPFMVLFLEIDPELVDCNVHPAKEEIRFRDEGLVWRTAYAALRNALEGLSADMAEDSATHSPPTTGQSSPDRQDRVEVQLPPHQAGAEEPISEAENPSPSMTQSPSSPPVIARPSGQSANQTVFSPHRPDPPEISTRTPTAEQINLRPHWEAMEAMRERSGSPNRYQGAPVDSHPPGQEISHHDGVARSVWTVVGQVLRRYIVCETDGRVAFFDQHALHERILFEDLRHALARSTIASQSLIAPLTIEVQTWQVDLLVELIPEMEQIGLSLEHFGDQTFVANALPQDLPLDQVAGFVSEALEDVGVMGNLKPMSERQERILARLACRSAVKAGDVLSLGQMQSLVDQFSQRPVLATCPHGRPPVKFFEQAELDKWFDRP